MMLAFLDTYRDMELLILQVGMGDMFMVHGAPKIFGGPEVWEKAEMAIRLNGDFTRFGGVKAAFS